MYNLCTGQIANYGSSGGTETRQETTPQQQTIREVLQKELNVVGTTLQFPLSAFPFSQRVIARAGLVSDSPGDNPAYVPFFKVPEGNVFIVINRNWDFYTPQGAMDLRVELRLGERTIFYSNPLLNPSAINKLPPFGNLSLGGKSYYLGQPGRDLSTSTNTTAGPIYGDNYSSPFQNQVFGIAMPGEEVNFVLTSASSVYKHWVILSLDGYYFPINGNTKKEILESMRP